MRRYLLILLLPFLFGSGVEAGMADDPLLADLEALAKARNTNRESSSSTPERKATSSSEPLLSDYPFQGRRRRLHNSVRVEAPSRPTSTSPRVKEVHYYHPPTPESSSRPSSRTALALKRIVEPLPQDYAQTYLKMKTLLDPTRKYVQVHIDKSRQRMWVYLDNQYVGDWKVSTARRGYWTPVGVYRPYTLHRMHYSRKYHNSPMPWSVFFKGGYAIHGTNAIRRLGRPASHGCVRVHPRNAKKLYQLIKRYGKQNTRIIIRG